MSLLVLLVSVLEPYLADWRCCLSWDWDTAVWIVPGEVVWWLGKPGGWLESVHRLRKLMVGETHWLQALMVCEDVRREPRM